MRRLSTCTLFGSVIVWVAVIFAVASAAPEAWGTITPLLGGGVAVQLILLGNLAVKVSAMEKNR